ncbi:MAG: helix-turn-helix transcriptional regulator [Anaerolineae bacterium]|nr:helix-turn-helix transcriptional regulator [Anaerolineae bacterium]
MLPEPDIAAVATLIGEPARAIILSALLSGKALPASELASRAHVTPQTASSHLAKLLAGDLISVTVMGRYRYYALKNSEVAQALEALQVIAPAAKNTPSRRPKIAPELCHARTCYDHLAGKLGVALSNGLIAQGYLLKVEQHYELTAKGATLAESWGIDVGLLKKKRRRFAYACLDWSERRFHVAGALGAAIAAAFFAKGWVKHLPDTRALKVTDAGVDMLQRDFGIALSDVM